MKPRVQVWCCKPDTSSGQLWDSNPRSYVTARVRDATQHSKLRRLILLGHPCHGLVCGKIPSCWLCPSPADSTLRGGPACPCTDGYSESSLLARDNIIQVNNIQLITPIHLFIPIISERYRRIPTLTYYEGWVGIFWQTNNVTFILVKVHDKDLDR